MRHEISELNDDNKSDFEKSYQLVSYLVKLKLDDKSKESIGEKVFDLMNNLPKHIQENFISEFVVDYSVETKMSKEVFCYILDWLVSYIHTNDLTDLEKSELFAEEESVLWKRIDDYKDLILSKLDFENYDKLSDVLKYLTFIKLLNNYVGSDVLTPQVKHNCEILKQFFNKINIELHNQNINYFLYLYASYIKSENNVDNVLQENEVFDKFEQDLIDKYSTDWLKFGERELDKYYMQQLLMSDVKKPFVIAPQTYAIFDGINILLADKKDFNYITTKLQQLKEIIDNIDTFKLSDDKYEDVYAMEMNDRIDENSNYIEDQILEKELREKIDEIIFDISNYFTISLNESSISKMNSDNVIDADFVDYIALQQSFIKQQIQADLDIDLSRLSIPEQFYFLSFSKRMNVNNVHKLKTLTQNITSNKDKLNRLKSFLSLEQGGKEMGDKILQIGENLDEQDVNIIFAKYAELVDITSEVEKYIKEQFGDVTQEQIEQIVEKLLVRGKKLLELVADNLELSRESLHKVLQKIGNVSADIELFKATIKNARRDGINVLEQMKDMRIMTLSGKELQNNEKIIKRMRKMYADNYTQYPKLQKVLVDSLDDKLSDSNTLFHIATYKDEQDKQIMTFLTTQKQENGNIYFGSFNTDNEVFGGASIGLSLAEEIFTQRENEGAKKIEAHTVPQEGINSIYINRYHFVADEIVENYENTGIDPFHIVREKKNQKYFFQNDVSKEELKSLIIDSKDKVNEDTDKFIIKINDKNSISKISKQFFDKGFVLTKYDIDQKTGEIYCGFEKKQE